MNKYRGIGVDIGGSHILSAAINLATGAVDESTRSYVKIDNKKSKEQIMHDWASCLNQTLANCDLDEISGVGFAMPGPFNYKKGIALFKDTDKYEELYGLHVESLLRPLVKIGDVPFRYHNDASCFALGVDGYGVAKSYRRSISITLGTGFGSAFIDSGLPIVIRQDVPEDGCLWHLPFKESIADDHFSTRWFLNKYEKCFGKKMPGVKEIAEEAQHNGEVKKLFDEFGENMAVFLEPWIKKFQPELIVLGGNMSGAYDLFSPSLYSHLGDSVRVDFKVSLLMEDAALVGSVRLLDDGFWIKIKDDLPEK